MFSVNIGIGNYYSKIKKFLKLDLSYVKNLIENEKIGIDTIMKHECEFFEYSYRCKVYTTFIYGAIVNDDTLLIDYLLSNNANVNIIFSSLNTDNVIHRVLRNENYNLLYKLVDHGADLNVSVNDYHIGCVYDSGEDLDKYRVRNTVLSFAIYSRNRKFIKYVIDQGVEFKKGTKTISPRLWFSNYHYDCYDFIKFFWDMGIDILENESPSGLRSTFLVKALQSNNLRLAKDLLADGADINCSIVKETGKLCPILDAIIRSELEVLSFVLEHCKFKSINALTENNRSSLHTMIISLSNLRYSYTFEMINNISILLCAGIDINIIDNNNKVAIEYLDGYEYNNIKPILEHIVKLDVAKCYYVCKKNLEYIENLDFDQFRRQCQQELKIMQTMKINNSKITYYNSLYLSIHKMAIYLKFTDLNMITYYSDGEDDRIELTKVEMIFPLYGKFINYRLVKVAVRIDLLKKSAGIIENILYLELPDTFMRQIYSYLDNYDLCKLIGI